MTSLSGAERGKRMVADHIDDPDKVKALLQCTLCGFVSVKPHKTKYHVIHHHLNKRTYKCPLCDTYKVGSAKCMC